MIELVVRLFEFEKIMVPIASLFVRCNIRSCHRLYDGGTWGVTRCECGQRIVLCSDCLGDRVIKLDHDTPFSIQMN